MKKIFGYLAIAMMVCCLAAPAWSYDLNDSDANGETGHVSVAANGKGDFIIFPFYTAEYGFKTRFTVINTSATEACVAKVVVKSGNHTQELLDFFIYLSAQDVWIGTIQVNDFGQLEMYSEDGSTLNAQGQFASASAPMRAPIPLRADQFCSSIDQADLGYVMVMGNWFPQPEATYHQNHAGLKEAFDDLDFLDDDFRYTENILAGHYEVYNTAYILAGAAQPVVLRNMNASQKFSVNDLTQINRNFFYNTLEEIEAAISKNHLVMPYLSKADLTSITWHMLTFPTKQTTIDLPPLCTVNSVNSPYFLSMGVDGPHILDYASPFVDLNENRNLTAGVIWSPPPENIVERLPYEVNRIWSRGDPDDPNKVNLGGVFDGVVFDEGYAEYEIIHPSNTGFIEGDDYVSPLGDWEIRYEGAPVIPVTVFFDASRGGLSMINNAFAAYTDDVQIFTQDGGVVTDVTDTYRFENDEFVALP